MPDLIFTEQNQILHHGVEGQKWGDRNGPPYPLDRRARKALRTERKLEKIKQKTAIEKAKKEYKEEKQKNKDLKRTLKNKKINDDLRIRQEEQKLKGDSLMSMTWKSVKKTLTDSMYTVTKDALTNWGKRVLYNNFENTRPLSNSNDNKKKEGD